MNSDTFEIIISLKSWGVFTSQELEELEKLALAYKEDSINNFKENSFIV